MSQEPSVHFKLNIPVSLKDRLSEAAERSGRSLTSEILTRLQAGEDVNLTGHPLDQRPGAVEQGEEKLVRARDRGDGGCRGGCEVRPADTDRQIEEAILRFKRHGDEWSPKEAA